MSDESQQEAKTDSEWLANIYEMLAETEDLTVDEVKAAIREEGDDPDALIKRGMTFIEQQRQVATKRMLEEAKEKKNAMLNQVEPAPGKQSSLERLKEKVKEAWGNLSESTGGQLQMSYRNLETLTEQDLYSLLDDLERLSKLSEQEKEDGSRS